jgi:3D (Asp-Asp-Asp) domain-containing protein
MRAAILSTLLALAPASAHGSSCPAGAELYQITGYLRTSPDMNPTTADGTSITTAEAIAAGSYNLPLGAYVWVDDLPLDLPFIYRIADRGYLGARHIDLAVWSRADAFAVTGYRCVRAFTA